MNLTQSWLACDGHKPFTYQTRYPLSAGACDSVIDTQNVIINYTFPDLQKELV